MTEHRKKPQQQDECIDRQSADSFPASDPPSYAGSTAGTPRHDEADKQKTNEKAKHPSPQRD